MCVAIPGEIVSIEADSALVDFGGTRRAVSLALLDGAEPGDFVVVHAGFALHRVDPEEARQTLELLRGILDEEPG